jgi:hypothetical protein
MDRRRLKAPTTPRRTANRRAFVFMAVLGVLAVAIILAFTMAGATRISYDMTGATAGRLHEQLMVQSVMDYALYLIERGEMTTDGKPQPFEIEYDSLKSSTLLGTVVVASAPADADFYRPGAVAHRPGDVVVQILSPQMVDRYQRYALGERYMLYNLENRRLRMVDVTATIEQLKRAQEEAAKDAAPEEPA